MCSTHFLAIQPKRLRGLYDESERRGAPTYLDSGRPLLWIQECAFWSVVVRDDQLDLRACSFVQDPGKLMDKTHRCSSWRVLGAAQRDAFQQASDRFPIKLLTLSEPATGNAGTVLYRVCTYRPVPVPVKYTVSVVPVW